MKSNFYRLLAAMLLFCCGQGLAQNVLAPYGQDTQEPWDAKYFYAIIGTEEPDENWFAEDFDDSAWESIEGPISNRTNLYYATKWKDVYSTYWVRRSFTVEKPSENNIFYFQAIHDDTCEAYLNGHLIYNNTSVVSSTTTTEVTKNVCDYIHEGENVLAVKVSDVGRGNAFMDFGLYSYFMKDLVNGDFNSNSGWSGSFNRGSLNGDYTAYKYGRNWTCEQSMFNNPEGLYLLSANACGLDYYNKYEDAYNARNNDLSAKLFINNKERSIPSAFSETAETDIYSGRSWKVDGGYVPNTENYTQNAFQRDMYKTTLFSYYEPDSTNTMTVGIHCYPSNDINRWAAWDNFSLNYINEEELGLLADSLVVVHNSLSAKNQDKNVKEVHDNYLAQMAYAQTYKEKGLAYADLAYYEPTVRKSVEAYELMISTHKSLSDNLAETSELTSPATIEEATEYASVVETAYNNGSYDNEAVAQAVSKMNKLMERLDYLYLDFNITTPGSLGDSILSKVEYFNQVVSLKVSGDLNSADLSTIKDRLTSLRELDMRDVNMTEIPEKMFYEHRQLEIAKLPTKLTKIGNYAFYRCNALTYLDFPTTLTSIGDQAYYECTTLPELVLQEGVTYLGNYSFAGTNIKYAKLPSTLKKIEHHTFYHAWKIAEVEFPEGLERIENSAFEGCPVLNNVVLPSTVTYLGTNAFAYCSALSNLSLNEGLFQIADNAFYDCDALTEVTLPSSVVLINPSPFDYCDNLRKVTCLSIEPPYMTDQIPYGLSMDGRELYVPALSINTYKQTSGWDKFQVIKPIDYLPENITILGNVHLTLPENIPSEYKPNLSLIHDKKGTNYYQYGALTVNGEGTLSLSSYSMTWDPNFYMDYANYTPGYCSLVNNSHLRADNVSVKFYTRNRNWTFITVPFDVKVSEIETIEPGTTSWVIRRYDGKNRAEGEANNTWFDLTGDDVLKANQGYIIQGSRYVGNSYENWSGYRMNAINNGQKNNIFTTADITVPLEEYQSEYAHNRSWNLIGNPYPSFYDTRFMDFTAPITVWNIKNSTYSAYSPVDDSYILCPGEAFFVQRPIDKESITFSKEGRQNNRTVRALNAPVHLRAYGDSPITSSLSERTIVNLSISDGNTSDRTRVVINDSAKFDYEADKDAPKFMSSDESVAQIFSSVNGVDFAINERPMGEGSVMLGTRIGAKGQYTITLDNEVNLFEVVLEDKLSGEMISLEESEGYSFFANEGNLLDRFVLHLNNTITGISSTMEENSTVDDAYYTIDGIRLEEKPTQRGIYIHNHKKIIVK